MISCLRAVGVPDLHVAHEGEAGDGLPVASHDGQGHVPDVAGAEAVIAGGNGKAGRQALYVVLERSRQRLVEVVQVEHQGPLGRCEPPEVRQVGVAAELHVQPRRRCATQVGGHDLGRPPIERERRSPHPAVADRDQVGFAGEVLRFQQAHRVGTVTGRGPSGMARQRRPFPRRPAPGPALLDARVRHFGYNHVLVSLR